MNPCTPGDESCHRPASLYLKKSDKLVAGMDPRSAKGPNRPCRTAASDRVSSDGIREVGREGWFARFHRGWHLLTAGG
jgi:hypothetical protein